MKSFFALLMLAAFSCNVMAQKVVFLRIYDMKGKKINKGRLFAATNSLLIIGKDKSTDTISVTDIGMIKTKHSAGNNIIAGSAVGATILIIAGVASAQPDDFIFGYTPAAGALVGFILGAPAGTAVGAITALLKNTKRFIINGNPEKWKEFIELMHPNTHAVN